MKSKAAVTLLRLRFIGVGDMSSFFDCFHRYFRFIFLLITSAPFRFGSRTNVFHLVKRKSRLKPAKLFTGCGKAEGFWIDYTTFRLYHEQHPASSS